MPLFGYKVCKSVGPTVVYVINRELCIEKYFSHNTVSTVAVQSDSEDNGPL